jgi:ribonuclease P protein component
VPKRQARRAVTRNLLKRQMRECFHRHAATLPKGLWLLRLARGIRAARLSCQPAPICLR